MRSGSHRALANTASPSAKANPACRLGTAAYGLKSSVVEPVASPMGVSVLTASANPRPASRGGAVGNSA